MTTKLTKLPMNDALERQSDFNSFCNCCTNNDIEFNLN